MTAVIRASASVQSSLEKLYEEKIHNLKYVNLFHFLTLLLVEKSLFYPIWIPAVTIYDHKLIQALTITEPQYLRLVGTSGGHLVQCPGQAESCSAGGSVPCPESFWVSPTKKTSQPLYTSCAKSQWPSIKKVLPDVQREPLVFQLLPFVSNPVTEHHQSPAPSSCTLPSGVIDTDGIPPGLIWAEFISTEVVLLVLCVLFCSCKNELPLFWADLNCIPG